MIALNGGEAAATAAHALGAGCDLVFVPAFRKLLKPRFLQRAFSPEEVLAGNQRADPAESLAARWAAKEAACKAFRQLAQRVGAPTGGLGTFRDYAVEGAPAQPPRLKLSGRPAALVEALRCDGARVHIALSLTHDGDYAAAFIVLHVEAA